MQLINWLKNFNFFFEENIKKEKIFSKFKINKNYIEILELKLSKLLQKNTSFLLKVDHLH